MKLKDIIIIVILVGMSLIYTWYEANRPKPVDWSETYSPEDKIPFGTYIVHHSLPALFPDAKIKTSRFSIVEEFDYREEEVLGTYIFVNTIFKVDPVELERLLGWVENGNQLFIAAESMSDTLLNKFSLQLEHRWESCVTKLFSTDNDEKEYLFINGSDSRYFVLPQNFKGQQLGGRISNDSSDFIRIPYGEGQVYLNLNPLAFTNRWALDSVCGDYYYKALSWLPEKQQTIIWDAYQTMGRQGVQTPLRVILRYPGLKLALYLLLATTFCYVLFRIRREQRPIPVVRPPENKMLEFISTVSTLFYRQKDHTAIALKQIDFFLGEVRQKYHLHTDVLDERFVSMLSERSGVEAEDTQKLIQLILKIKGKQQVHEAELRDLMHGTELFIRKLNY